MKVTYQNAICIFLFTLVCVNYGWAQQFNNWYFPNALGVTFNTSPPIYLAGGQITQNKSCASISNNLGQLLFYTDGVRVWNKNHQLMPNGNNLFGAFSQTNSALIIPFFNNDFKYYIFTADGITIGFPSVGIKGYNYSVVDMSLNSGLGDVTLKNIFLYGPSAEKLCAVSHSNGTDIWLVTKDQADKFYSFKITCSGIVTTPVISTTGTTFAPNPYPYFVGDIKASGDGRYIGMTQFQRDYFEIYKFSNSSGTLSMPIKQTLRGAYGVEFSPDNSKMYISCNKDSAGSVNSNTIEIYQYSLNVYDSSAIASSKIKVGEKFGGSYCGALQLGPNNKIYHVGSNFSALDEIQYPNISGINCSFQLNQIPLSSSLSGGRLPYAPTFLFTNQNVQISTYSIAADCRTVTLTGRTYIRGNSLSFKWRFGDGDSAVQVVPSNGGDTTYTTVTHTFPPGIDTFNVQLFVTSDTVCGQGSAGKRIVFSLQRPTARFGYSAICGSLSVPFSDSSLSNGIATLQYRWQFVDKNNAVLGTSTQQNPSFTFPLFDTVKAVLIVSGTGSCTRPDTLIKTIVLKAKPVAAFTYANNCGSLQASFTASSSVATSSLQSSTWLFGDGNSATTLSPQHTYSSYGSYTAKLVATSSQGCVSDTAVQTVLIKAKPIARMSYDTATCATSPVLLQDSSAIAASTIQSYWWAVPAISQTATTATLQPLFAAGGSYVVLHAVTSAQGCPSDTLTQSIAVEDAPVATFATATQSGCAGQTLSFAPTATIAYGQVAGGQWAIGNGPWATVTGSTFNYTFPQAGNYIIRYRAISRHGCTGNVATQAVSIGSLPVAFFSFDSTACTGKAVTFTNSSTNADGAITASNWSISNGMPVSTNSSSNYSYTFLQPGSYSIQLAVSTAAGCSISITKTIAIGQAAAGAGPDVIVRAGEVFQLSGSGGLFYHWQPPTGLSSDTAQRPVGRIQRSEVYTVQATTAEGCTGIDEVKVVVLQPVMLPNAFSPNGDGINDSWQSAALLSYPQAVLQVFDRYGQLIHQTKGGSATLWDGTRNGKLVPTGTYYYVLTLNSPLGDRPMSGWVIVVR